MTEPAAPTPPTPPNYKDTLNLPKTNFDMKANLTQREPVMLKQWQDENLYQKIRDRRGGHPKGKWVLHDGPPYANGDIHMGHLINKVLKDIVIKFRTMQGHDAPYVPGWDCHGLPIESAIQKELGPKFRELSKDQVRQKCHDYAMKYVQLQSDSFARLGIFFGPGEQDRYLTLNPKYESGILDVLAELVKRDLVYRKKKPVHWCTNDRTALAEAELEYATRKDHSIYVNFKLANVAALKPSNSTTEHFIKQLQPFTGHAYLMIWTTTPWTLPANRAVAVHPDHEYIVYWYREKTDPESNGDYTKCVIVAAEAHDRIRNLGYFARSEANGSVRGRDLVEMGLKYFHPLGMPDNHDGSKQMELDGLTGSHSQVRDRIQPVVLADYVTLDDGTGLVHTAPGHGKEDYQTGIKYGLEIYNPVLADGKYDDTVPDFLKGQSIWAANEMVINKLTQTGALFHHQQFDHEYPHCWRCKKPVIFRATEQWFVKAASADDTPSGDSGAMLLMGQGPRQEHAGESTAPQDSRLKTQASSPLWSNAKAFVNSVQWIPAWGKNRIDGMLDTRPDWCISRQRSWGVPIPAFFDDKGNILFTEKSVRRIGAYFKEHGADSWYTHTPAQLLGAEEWTDTVITPDGRLISEFRIQNSELTKSSDILDVWFESGASHHAVLECTHPELGYPADLYLEGSDQHRGWFQSSLLEASGYKSEPPFKQVLTHGFVVDEKGHKMSKAEGNGIKVETALKQYGADVLRLWVSSVDYQNDIPCGPNLLAKTADAYRKIRNTIRYLLGNLYDFNYETGVHIGFEPYSIDSWMEWRFSQLQEQVLSSYERYEFHNVFKLVYEFCNVEISAVYAKAIKDRLYCELPDSKKRRGSQLMCCFLLEHLVKLIAPILAFTAEEAWNEMRKLPGGGSLTRSVHLAQFEVFECNPMGHAEKHWGVLMPLIEKGNKQLDDLKKSVGLGNALDAEAVIIVPSTNDDVAKLIAQYGPEIEDALGVGFHRIEHGEIWDIKIEDTREKYPSCARSWKRRPDVGSDKDYPDLSARDAAVVSALRKGT